MRTMKILVFLGFAGFLGALAAGPPLPPAAVDRLGLGVPTDLVLSPTGSFLALATSIGVEIRDPKTLELWAFLAPHQAWIQALALSPDGEKLAAAFHDGTVRLWRVADWTKLETFFFPEPVGDVAWSPGGEVLYAAAGDRVYGVDLSSGHEEKLAELPGRPIKGLSISSAGKLAVLTENEAWLFDAHTRVVLWRRAFSAIPCRRAVFLPTGELVLSGSYVRALDPHTGWDLWQRPGWVAQALAVQEGFLAGASGPSLALLDLAQGTEAWVHLAHARDVVGLAAFAETLYTVGLEGALKAWDLRTKTLLRALEAVRGPVYALSLARSGSLLAVGSVGAVYLWDLRTKEARVWDERSGSLVAVLGVGEKHVLVGSGGFLRTLDLASGETRASVGGVPTGLPWPLGFSILATTGDGALVAYSCGDLPRSGTLPTCRICIRNGKDLQLLKTLDAVGCLGMPRSLTLSADGALLAVGSEKRVDVWAWESDLCRLSLSSEGCDPVLLALSPHGRFLAVALGLAMEGEGCGEVQIWNVALGSRLASLGVDEDVTALAFAPDEERLVLGTSSGKVLLVDVNKPELPKKSFAGHTGAVFALVFTADGTVLYSGALDGTILVWATK